MEQDKQLAPNSPPTDDGRPLSVPQPPHDLVNRLCNWVHTRHKLPAGVYDDMRDAASEIQRLTAEVEALREYKRKAMEDIITLGQMVGRHCPVCQRGEK